MKRVIMIALVLMLSVGTASASQTYIGLFNSATAHDQENTSLTTTGMGTIYLWINADAAGLKTFEIHVQGMAGDMSFPPTYTIAPVLSVGGPFDEANGWKATWTPENCMTGWVNICSFMAMFNTAAHEINIVDNPISAGHDFINCSEELFPLSVMTVPFGINMDGTPAEESSWGAVKSLMK